MTRKLIQPCHLSASRQPFCLCMAKLQFVALPRHASIPSRRSFFFVRNEDRMAIPFRASNVHILACRTAPSTTGAVVCSDSDWSETPDVSDRCYRFVGSPLCAARGPVRA